MLDFDLQPTLRGTLLWLRPLKPQDFEDLYRVSSDPLVWEQHPERFRYQRGVFEKFFQGALDSRGALLALDARTQEVIGSSRYTAWDPQARSVEVGYSFLARRCWGHGFNPEMKKLMLAHAFQCAEQVSFFIGESNLRSRTAIERIGARFVERVERKPQEGAAYASVVYRIDKAEFLRGPLANPPRASG